jgi:RNA polymerase sigma-70 factor, ECF subfamily
MERMWRVPENTRQREFLQLLEAHGSTLKAMLRRLAGSHHDAEDAFQETASRIWHGLADCPRLRNPRAWMLTIGYRAFITVRARRLRTENLQDETVIRHDSPLDLAQKSEDRDRLRAAIAELPEPIREVVALHYVGGLSLTQTAAAMQISQGTVKSRLNTAIRTLRRALE